MEELDPENHGYIMVINHKFKALLMSWGSACLEFFFYADCWYSY
jgi:hypothetical protein